MDSRTKIIEAAAECLATVGFKHLSVSAVAERAQVSRPTVYAYFESRDELVSATIEHAAATMITTIVRRARRATTAADFVVNAVLAARREFLGNPALAPLVRPEVGSLRFVRGSVSAYAIEVTREFLAPLTEYEPSLEPDMDEVAETVLRFLFSFVLFESATSGSESRLRGYLHRRMVPALGLTDR